MRFPVSWRDEKKRVASFQSHYPYKIHSHTYRFWTSDRPSVARQLYSHRVSGCAPTLASRQKLFLIEQPAIYISQLSDLSVFDVSKQTVYVRQHVYLGSGAFLERGHYKDGGYVGLREEPLEKVEEFTEAIGIREFPVPLFPLVSLAWPFRQNPKSCLCLQDRDLHLPDSLNCTTPTSFFIPLMDFTKILVFFLSLYLATLLVLCPAVLST